MKKSNGDDLSPVDEFNINQFAPNPRNQLS